MHLINKRSDISWRFQLFPYPTDSGKPLLLCRLTTELVWKLGLSIASQVMRYPQRNTSKFNGFPRKLWGSKEPYFGYMVQRLESYL